MGVSASAVGFVFVLVFLDWLLFIYMLVFRLHACLCAVHMFLPGAVRPEEGLGASETGQL